MEEDKENNPNGVKKMKEEEVEQKGIKMKDEGEDEKKREKKEMDDEPKETNKEEEEDEDEPKAKKMKENPIKEKEDEKELYLCHGNFDVAVARIKRDMTGHEIGCVCRECDVVEARIRTKSVKIIAQFELVD
jgi:hypothetical protein